VGDDRQDLPGDQGARPRRVLKDNYGLLQNRAMHVLSVAFPSDAGWDEPEKLRAALWSDPASAAILAAVEPLAMALPNVVTGQRKGFTAFQPGVPVRFDPPAQGRQGGAGLRRHTRRRPQAGAAEKTKAGRSG